MLCLVHHWLPGQPINEDTMGEAIYLEKRYWENMSNAVAAGIQKAL
ncbi:DUF6890 family protein [Methylophaga thalassica]